MELDVVKKMTSILNKMSLKKPIRFLVQDFSNKHICDSVYPFFCLGKAVSINLNQKCDTTLLKVVELLWESICYTLWDISENNSDSGINVDILKRSIDLDSKFLDDTLLVSLSFRCRILFNSCSLSESFEKFNKIQVDLLKKESELINTSSLE